MEPKYFTRHAVSQLRASCYKQKYVKRSGEEISNFIMLLSVEEAHIVQDQDYCFDVWRTVQSHLLLICVETVAKLPLESVFSALPACHARLSEIAYYNCHCNKLSPQSPIG